MKLPPWPAWLPYPISWIRAFGLTYTLVFLVKTQFPLQYSDSILAVLIGAWIAVPPLFAFFHWAIASVITFLLARLPVYPKLDTVRNYLSDRLPNLRRSHWREGVNALIVSFVAFAVSAFVLSYVLPAPSKEFAYENDAYLLRRSILRLRFDLIPMGMVIISAYLYQYDLWARQRRATKQANAQNVAKRRSPTATNIPVNPIEIGLNQLAAESGDARMRAVRKPSPAPKPKPETPEWYVFRSGKSEGPYTKDQLRDVQQISDRTLVQLEKTEWQRAGEIAELANYLTQK